MASWRWGESMNDKMKKSIHQTATSLFPLLRAKSLTDLATITKLFEYNTVSFYLRQMFYFMTYSVFFVRALQLPVPEDLQFLRASVYGSVGHRMAVISFFVYCHFLAARVWLYTVFRKHQSIETIGFMQLLKQLKEKSQVEMLSAVKLISTNIITSRYALILVLILIELYFSISTMHLLFILCLSVAFFPTSRSLAADEIVLYVFAVAGCNAVLEQMEQLRKTAQHYPHVTFILLNEYFKTVRSIKKLNPLGKFLVLLIELIVVPFGSMIFILLASPTNDHSAFILKVFTLVTTFAFGLFGYLLIAKLAQVNQVSKKLYTECNSLIARRQNLPVSNVLVLRNIIEDASCSRSHLVLREFAGTITQMDAYESIISTVSLLTLFFSSRSFTL